MCTLTTLALDPKIDQECSPKMCITNNAMPFFVTLPVIMYRQYYCAFWFLNTFVPELCRFIFQSLFLFFFFFLFFGFLYGKDV